MSLRCRSSALFSGVVLTLAAYNILKTSRAKHYGIEFKEGWVLDCYNDASSGKCLASMANDAKNCINFTTMQRAVNNCRISIAHRPLTDDVSISIVCARKLIPKHHELCWNYQSGFFNPI